MYLFQLTNANILRRRQAQPRDRLSSHIDCDSLFYYGAQEESKGLKKNGMSISYTFFYITVFT